MATEITELNRTWTTEIILQVSDSTELVGNTVKLHRDWMIKRSPTKDTANALARYLPCEVLSNNKTNAHFCWCAHTAILNFFAQSLVFFFHGKNNIQIDQSARCIVKKKSCFLLCCLGNHYLCVHTSKVLLWTVFCLHYLRLMNTTRLHLHADATEQNRLFHLLTHALFEPH